MKNAPSTSLRSLIEQIEAVRPGPPVPIETFPLAKHKPLLIAAISLAENAICFNLGDMRDFEGLPTISTLFRLPYRVCWFEFFISAPPVGTEIWKFGVIAFQDAPDAHMSLAVFGRGASRHWSFLGQGVAEPLPGGGNAIRHDFDSGTRDEEGAPVIEAMATFLTAMNCCNVTRTEHKPDAALQKARALRGKKPLFSYWTLDIDLDHEQTDRESMGGTHASPRLHLRRGHARQYAAGKYCWVQPHVVGNKALGMIHKDYRAVAPQVAP